MSNKSTALFVIGMICYWPLLRRNGLQTLFLGHTLDSSNALLLVGVFLTCGLLSAFAFVLGRRFLAKLFNGKSYGPLFIAIAWLGAKFLLFLQLGRVEEFLAVADAVLFSVLFVFLSIAWGDRVIRAASAHTTSLVILSFLLGFIIQQLIAFFPEATRVFFMLSPVISLGCWYRSASAQREESLAAPLRSLFRLPLGLIALFAAFLLVGSLFRGFFTPPLSSDSQAGMLVTQNLPTMALAAVLLVMSLRSSRRMQSVNVAWVVVALAFFAGLFLIALLNPQEHDIGTNITVMARTCMTLLFWITLANASREAEVSPVLSFGLLFVVPEIASSALGYLVPGFLPVVRSIGESNSLAIALLCAFMLLVASMVFLSGQIARAAGGASRFSSEETTERLGQKPEVAAVAAEGGLTPRETEVASYLARGYSQKKISEMLVVSDGTTQSHIKSIYRKLDVHSRQEFIDKVESEVRHVDR